MTAFDIVAAHPFSGADVHELARRINELAAGKAWNEAITVVPLGVDPGPEGCSGSIEALILVGKLATVPIPSYLP